MFVHEYLYIYLYVCMYVCMYVRTPPFTGRMRYKVISKRSKVGSNSVFLFLDWYYLPTPPLGQDMTQGQFLSGV